MKYLVLIVSLVVLFGCLGIGTEDTTSGNGSEDSKPDIVQPASVSPNGSEDSKPEIVQPASASDTPETIEVPVGMYGYSPMEIFSVLIHQDKATIFFIETQWKWQEIKLSDIKLNNAGWYEIHIRNRNSVILRGGNYFEILTGDTSNDGEFGLNVGKPSFEWAESDRLLTLGIQSIEASSTLTEVVNDKHVSYTTEMLDKLFFSDYLGITNNWNADHFPWVEGEEGPGIGVTLDITFTEPSDHMVVLNGFVDPRRRHLFRANNRVKRALVRSLEADLPFSFEYQFADAVEFSHIPFPNTAKAVQLEILEVYPGERWDDTAISAIITNHTWGYDDNSIRGYLRLKTEENRYREEQ